MTVDTRSLDGMRGIIRFVLASTLRAKGEATLLFLFDYINPVLSHVGYALRTFFGGCLPRVPWVPRTLD